MTIRTTGSFITEPAKIVSLHRPDPKRLAYMISIKLSRTGQLASDKITPDSISSTILEYINMFGDPESAILRGMPIDVSLFVRDVHVVEINRMMHNHETGVFINQQKTLMSHHRQYPKMPSEYNPTYRSSRVAHEERGATSPLRKGRCIGVLRSDLIKVELDDGHVQLVKLVGIRTPSPGEAGHAESMNLTKRIVDGRRVTIDRHVDREHDENTWVASVYAEPNPPAHLIWTTPGPVSEIDI